MIECKVTLSIGKYISYRCKDPNRSYMNENIINKNLRDFFEEIFSTTLEKYNENKQPNKCITVEDYFIKNESKAQTVILQMGNMENYEAIVKLFGQQETDDFYKKILKLALEKWQKDNPAFKVFYAYLCMDESTPHIRLKYLPVSENSSESTAKVSPSEALAQMGFAKSEKCKNYQTLFVQWVTDRRKKYEKFWQQAADELLGNGVIKIIPPQPKPKKIDNGEIPFGAELRSYDMRKNRFLYEWEEGDYPWIVCRRCGGASKLKFNEDELARVVKRLFELNYITDEIERICNSDSLDILLGELNIDRSSVSFILKKQRHDNEYEIRACFGEGQYTFWVKIKEK